MYKAAIMTTPNMQDFLAQAHHRMVDALKKSDLRIVTSMFAEDIVLMPPNDTSIYGREEAVEWFGEYFAHFRIEGLAYTDRVVTALEGWAIERFNYRVAIQPIVEGERIVDEGRFLTVWKRDSNGEWKIAQQMWNSSRPIGSGTSRFMALLKQRLNVRARPER
jgi:ketosteroid isomerase-like protein